MSQNLEGELVIMDIATPPNAILSAFYKRSFAHYTVKERLPRILTQIIDTLVRNKDAIGNEFGEDAKEELKYVIGELSKLKYEIQTNKPIRPIQSNASDALHYNDYLAANPNITYFSAIWLYTESYMYRRIQEMSELSTHLKQFDCFQIQKQQSFKSSITAMEQLSSYLLPLFSCNKTNINQQFIKLLKLNLWGNKADLSFSGGHIEESHDPFELLESLEQNILCDHSEQIWKWLSDTTSSSQTVDIVLDNVGYELFTDLCLADFILTYNLAKRIRFYVKTGPYFISDATKKDFKWTLEEVSNSCNSSMQKLGNRWLKYIENGDFLIIEDDYWITALNYLVMQHVKPQLYEKLMEAHLIIFKGDLNYRKLIGEKNWDPTMPFKTCLDGFAPANLCILRTVKCDIVCGLEKKIVDNLAQEDVEWMSTGNYGVIQFADV